MAPDTAATCRHCQRRIINQDGRWVDPEATGDDSVWRETCDTHDTFTAEHEPVVALTEWLATHVADNGEEQLGYVDADNGTLTYAFAEAQNAGVVPDDTGLWFIANSDGTVEGALLTVDAPNGKRYASLFVDWKHLMDREAIGQPLLMSFFETILNERQRLLG